MGFNMNKFSQIILLVLFTIFSSGCLKFHEGSQVFVIDAKKVLVGASLADADAKIPDGATVLSVSHVNSFFGLLQYTSITGTK